VESKAILRWNMLATKTLDEAVKLRLRKLYPSAVTTEGEILVVSQLYRDRPRNVDDCRNKLAAMIRAALVVPKARKKTKPSLGSKLKRLEDKKRSTQRKTQRRVDHHD
jgi:ribosome-associated protein